MSMEAEYAVVLAEARKAALAAEKPLDVWRVSGAAERALGLDFYPGRGAPTWEGRQAETRFIRQVRRALDALADDGTLVKVFIGKSAEYLTPELSEQRQAEQARVADERQAKKDRLAAQRLRLAAFGIIARVEFGTVALSADQLDTLMNLAAKGLD